MTRAIRPDMTVRQLAYDCPATRDVFRRHGIPADRPPFGPVLPLDRAARLVGVPLEQLLQELSAVSGWRVDRSSPTSHRPFLIVALLWATLAGGTLGVWMAAEAAADGALGMVPARHAVTHATVQLWGFVVSFIVGIAFRWLPMASARSPVSTRLRALLLALLVVGTAALCAWCEAAEKLAAMGIGGAGALTTAACVVSVVFVKYTDPLKKPQVWSVTLALACAWLLGAAVVQLAAVLSFAGGPGSFSPGLRLLWSELVLAGFVFHCIFGFGLRILPPIVGAPVRSRWAAAAVTALSASAVVLVVGRLAGWRGTTLLSAVCQAVAWGCYLQALPRLRRPRASSPRPEQGPPLAAWMVSCAFVFLLAGLVLLAWAGYLELADQRLTAAASRVYWPQFAPLPVYDAGRHALTLGFVSGMIVGVGTRLVPMLEHRVLQWHWLAVPTYGLLVASVAVRIASDLLLLGSMPGTILLLVSAAASWCALALFGAMVARTFWPGDRGRLRRGIITERTPVALLIAEYPQTYDVLLEHGAEYLRRVRAVPAELTLGTLIRTERMDRAATLAAVQRVVADAPQQNRTGG